MSEADDELAALVRACLAAVPQFGRLRWGSQRAVVRYIRTVTTAIAADEGPDVDAIASCAARLTEVEFVQLYDRMGLIVRPALLAAAVELVTLAVVKRIWPERQFAYANWRPGQEGESW